MKPEEINSVIAEKCMGWHLHGDVYYDSESKDTTFDNGEPYARCLRPGVSTSGNRFDPHHRIDHAMMALEKFNAYSVLKDTINEKVFYKARAGQIYGKICDTPSAAISMAIVSTYETQVVSS